MVKNIDGFPQKSNIFLQILMIILKVYVTLKLFSFSVITESIFSLKRFLLLNKSNLFIYLFSIYLTLTNYLTFLTFGDKTGFPRRVAATSNL